MAADATKYDKRASVNMQLLAELEAFGEYSHIGFFSEVIPASSSSGLTTRWPAFFLMLVSFHKSNL